GLRLSQISRKNLRRYLRIEATMPRPSLVSESFTILSSSGERLLSRKFLPTSPLATFVSVPGVTPSWAESFDIGVGSPMKSSVKRILSCWGVSVVAEFGNVWPRKVSCCIMNSNTPASSVAALPLELLDRRIKSLLSHHHY